MKFISKSSVFLFPLLLLAFVFAITVNQTIGTDTYYCIKAGEMFLQKGIIFHDVFSNSAYGRYWYPYEWLFQIGVYYIQHFLGFTALDVLTCIFGGIQVILIYFFLRNFYRMPYYVIFSISLLYGLAIKIFLTARPQIIGNFFFLLSAFLLWNYVIKNKNYLWLLIPLYLLWINAHASFILILFFLGGYAMVSILIYWGEKNKEWLQKAKILALYTVGLFLLTFTPPLYGVQYRLFWEFFTNNQVVQFLTEWQPLIRYDALFIVYTFILIVFAAIGILLRKHITKHEIYLLLPLVILAFTSYLAMRNLLFGWFALIVIMAVISTKLRMIKHANCYNHLYLGVVIIVVVFFYRQVLSLPFDPVKANYPDNAATFILQHHLKGNMFNGVDYGDYLLYRLYPQQRVFIDGRVDLYLCCELQEMKSLERNLNDNDYKNLFFSLLNKHHISFILVDREGGVPIRMNALLDNPDWSLVFWDDKSQIFVRRHDLNDDIIQQFGAVAAQPYSTALYDHQHIQQAIDEYTRMISVADSAKSRNILGIIYLRQGDVQSASNEFQKATEVNSSYPPPYVNLAYIAYKEGDYNQAMSDYQLAIQNKSDDAVPYITLGELYIKINNDTEKAKEVWQEGIQNVSNQVGVEKLTELINSN